MTHEEILLNYTDVLNDANGHTQLCLYRDDALKAMAEAVEAAKHEWYNDEANKFLSSYEAEVIHQNFKLVQKLKGKDKEIAGLKGEIINALRKETGYSRERCVDALVKSSYNLHMAKDIAIKNHPKF